MLSEEYQNRAKFLDTLLMPENGLSVQRKTSTHLVTKSEDLSVSNKGDYAKTFDCVVHNKLWKILKEMGIPDHLTCLLTNLYADQEARVRIGYGTTDWFQIGKGICQGCILSPCLFNFYAEYIMRNAGLEEAQAELKVVSSAYLRNINNLR